MAQGNKALLRFLRMSVLGFALVLAGSSAAVAGASPKVVVTIKPLQGLVASIMGDVGTPFLLLQGAASPHSFSLKPSAARRLARADVVFAVGAGLEAGLASVLTTLSDRGQVVYVADSKGVRLRQVGAADTHAHHHDDDGAHSGDDPHVWLDPRNARAIAAKVAAVLSSVDPENAAAYARNAAVLDADLRNLDEELRSQTKAVRGRPYVVFHDGYGYFADRYDVPAAGWVVATPDRRPGARHLSALRDKMRAAGVTCIFTEPQFPPKQVRALAMDLNIRMGVLDPLGLAIDAGPGAYERTMRALTHAFVDCVR